MDLKALFNSVSTKKKKSELRDKLLCWYSSPCSDEVFKMKSWKTWPSNLSFINSKQELKLLDKLYIPDPDDQLVSTFDFSEKGLSGTLWAKVGDQYFTVTNVSAKCTDAMKSWPPCDGEAAAVYVSTKSPHMHSYILASNKPVYALVDNKTVYEASKLLKKGKLSASEWVSKLL